MKASVSHEGFSNCQGGCTLLHRYDGIYKVRKYWPEQGKAGFIVWRYMLERKVVQAPPNCT